MAVVDVSVGGLPLNASFGVASQSARRLRRQSHPGRKNRRKRTLSADGLVSASRPRASQCDGRQKRFEKTLGQESDRRNRDAVAHETKGLVDVRRQLVFVREPHQAGGSRGDRDGP
jgi:hypothetical protein